MIGHVARLAGWEWFKMRRRWMPWILLVILLLFSQLAIWGSYFNYRQLSAGGEVFVGSVEQSRTGGRPQTVGCADVLAEPPRLPAEVDAAVLPALRAQCEQVARERAEQLPRMYETFTVPLSIKQALAAAAGIGSILIAVLAASTIGVEYGWGTMRTALVRGTGRSQYLAGKLAVLLLVSLGALVVVAVAATVSSLVAGSLVEPPPGYVTPAWQTAAEALGRAWYGFVPMIALVVMLTVLTTSTATGMAIGIGYSIAEPLIMALLRQVTDRVDGVSDYLLGANITAWNGEQGFGPSLGTSDVQQFLVLLAYSAVFIVLAVRLIESRDVTKATGT